MEADWVLPFFSPAVFIASLACIQSVEHYQRKSPHINGLPPHSNTCINTFQCARVKYAIGFNLKISTIILQCTKNSYYLRSVFKNLLCIVSKLLYPEQ